MSVSILHSSNQLSKILVTDGSIGSLKYETWLTSYLFVILEYMWNLDIDI